MSIPFSLQARKQRGESHWQIIKHVLHRALALITMGFLWSMLSLVSMNPKCQYPSQAGHLLSYLAFMLIWDVYRFAVPLHGECSQSRRWHQDSHIVCSDLPRR